MTNIILIQTSLNKNSNTAKVIEYISNQLNVKGVNNTIIDLRDYNIQLCDGRSFDEYNDDMKQISKILQTGKAYILGYPVYNYSFSGACKNFIDIFSKFMDSKYIGIVNNSGGMRSANEGVGELMKILGRHNNITTIQPVTNTCAIDFNDNVIQDQKTIETINLLIDRIIEKIQ